jgi:hypothetical protein
VKINNSVLKDLVAQLSFLETTIQIIKNRISEIDESVYVGQERRSEASRNKRLRDTQVIKLTDRPLQR